MKISQLTKKVAKLLKEYQNMPAASITSADCSKMPLTLDSVKEAIKLLPKAPVDNIEIVKMCKKHYKALVKLERKDILFPGVGFLYGGIRVIIKPYLKKIKMYRKSGKVQNIKV